MMASIALSKMKVVVISTGVLTIAVAAKLSAPTIMYFFVYQLPVLWSSLVSWLRPPYLYLVINCIIISIAASSRFNKKDEGEDHRHVDYQQSHHRTVTGSFDGGKSPDSVGGDAFYGGKVVDSKKTRVDGNDLEENHNASSDAELSDDKKLPDDAGDEFVISRSTWLPPPREAGSVVEALPETVVSHSPAEKPLVSSRFGHRKSVRSSPEGARALRVSKPKRHETLENTWKTITEGRHMPLARHLKKSETVAEHDGQVTGGSSSRNTPGIDTAAKKSKTFRDRTNQQDSPSPPSTAGKLRKEPSLSHDELNKRVEAFIKKFNEQMRMQRQESLDQYREMINRRGTAQSQY